MSKRRNKTLRPRPRMRTRRPMRVPQLYAPSHATRADVDSTLSGMVSAFTAVMIAALFAWFLAAYWLGMR